MPSPQQHLCALSLNKTNMEICYVFGGQRIEYLKPTRWAEVTRVALERRNENSQSIGHTAFHRNKHFVYASVHCEVAVAMHLLSQDLDGPPPLLFIGVSKLSCLACRSLLKSLQHFGEQLCATQYASQAEEIKADVYSSFVDWYTTCIVARRIEIGSDS